MIRSARRGLLSAIGLVGVFMVLGCGDVGVPDDVVAAQEQQRLHRQPPAATERPPGLAEDLPSAVTTQPMAKED